MWNSSRTEVGLVLASLPRVVRTTGRQGFVYLHWNRIPLISGELGRTTTMCLIEHQAHGFGDQLSSPLYPFALPFLLRSSCACVTRRSSFHCFLSLFGLWGCARLGQDGSIHVVLEYMDRGCLSDVIHGWRGMEYGEDLIAAVTFQVA